jgi:putative FmdB family regulatory protein
MPIFEFRCVDCGDIFEKLFMSSDEKVDLCCPHCKSESIERVVSRSSYAMKSSGEGARSNVTTKSCGQGNQCMTLDLPGPTK